MNLYDFFRKCNSVIFRVFVQPIIKFSFKTCGKEVLIGKHSKFMGIKNIVCGNKVSIGEYNYFLSTNAKILIGNNVMFGPKVTIITGDHKTDEIGKFMIDVKKSKLNSEFDKDVEFEGDNWIGANSTILKGCKIGKGSIIAAGSIVTKSIPPYAIAGGVPCKVIKMRFSPEQIVEHERLLNENTNN